MITTWEEAFEEEEGSHSRYQSGSTVTLRVDGNEQEVHNVMVNPTEFERVQEQFDEMRAQIPSMIDTVECSITVGDINND